MTTLRQIEANRRNSLKSCGPTSTEGKQRSRENSLKHGLSGAGVVLHEDERALIEQRKEEWRPEFQPDDPREEWLFDQLVTASFQVERCQREEQALRAHLAARAATCWDDDRRLAAEIVGANLSRKPALVSRQLRQTTHGCDWIIERWESLGRILDAKGEWSAAQTSLALDLLGTPQELREGPTRLDPLGPDEDVRAHRAALVATEIARLREAKKTVLDELDAREQAAAELGLEAEIPAPLARLRRYAASCERRFKWALNQLGRGRKVRPEGEPAAAAEPTAPVTGGQATRATRPVPSRSAAEAEEWEALMRERPTIPEALHDDPGESLPFPYCLPPAEFTAWMAANAPRTAPSLADPPLPARRA
jgi:hypothetical protein